MPTGMNLTIANEPCATGEISLVHGAGVLYVSGIDKFTAGGAWEGEMSMDFHW